MTDAELDRWFAERQAAHKARQEETRRLLHAALSAGRQVVERAGYGDLSWPERSPFIPECNTADYLTEHLMARHVGFGYDLVIDGEVRQS